MSALRPNSLDHVALWVAERRPLVALLCGELGMHVIEETDDFTLVGAEARHGKLTLFAADGPRERGVLGRVVLRVRDLEEAVDRLPDYLRVERRGAVVTFEGPQGLGLGLTSGDGIDYDLDHVVLRVPDPEVTAEGLAELGFAKRNGALAVADKEVRLDRGKAGAGPRPLLNHLAVLVDSATEVREEAGRRGLEIDKVVDAENTLAVFVRGPDRIVVEYVEHKPGFALV